MKSKTSIDESKLVRAAEARGPAASNKPTTGQCIEAELRDAAFLCWIFALMDLTIMYIGLAWLNVTKAAENRRASKVALLTYRPLKQKNACRLST